MPLVAHNALPSFAKLEQEGLRVLSQKAADQQDIRELHIGLLNMMPDAALEATERQFLRLIGASNPIAQFFVHPFTLDALPRDASARAHIDKYYESFDSVKAQGLDALIITGANVIGPELSKGSLLGTVDRGRRLGASTGDFDAVLLPGHACAARFSLWPAA